MDTFLHSQQRNATCAVAALRTVLHWQFNVRVAEAALAALGTVVESPIVVHGSTTADIRRMVRNANRAFNAGPPWTLRVRRQGTTKQLAHWVRRGRWPLVQVYVHEAAEYHLVVVVEVTPEGVHYFDPDPVEGKGIHVLPKDQFLAWWECPLYGERWWAVVNGGQLVVR